MDGTGGSTGAPGFDRLLPGGAKGVVGRCRDFVGESLASRGWLEDTGEKQQAVVEDVLLMTSELVTNACLHGGGPQEVTVRAEGSRLRVEVADAGPEPPELRPLKPPARPGGHGLRVVERLADCWGSAPRAGGGKVVWFEIEHA
ncbi:ATP-binding protein [Streptacidiphilus jiangxiensis]|uniref:Anti-sigma regulatory factor (Ser/Thr protein kinase) n=1 Tax=Streptacidiphilus jiangxiensis TaxID=235985 RepID=A0A1H7MZH2_STRJI|nr:ATP-binding protein [Streptacidiphilus jiangxiensis]SEL16716.1 Anti-sigma regulatory factor (Ser/Thr protein kinase) [Streptacidiphilus jiangxiensis]